MEDLALLDLLNCALCSERLEVTSKVLPCQHTFCKPCLLRLQASRLPLRCPECRNPVPGTVDELPSNLLLVRLLENLKQGSWEPTRDKYARYMVPPAMENYTVREPQSPPHTQNRRMPRSDGVSARALYSNRGSSPRELDVLSGDLVNLRLKVDENWHYGNANTSAGPVPANGVLLVSQPTAQPLCRALFNFDLKDFGLEETNECLTFLKGDIISVLRRVDEQWIEGQLGDKVGIFPVQFTEPNSVAAKLLEETKRKASDSSDPRPASVSGIVSFGGATDRRPPPSGLPHGPPVASFSRLLQGQSPTVSALNALNRPGHERPSTPPALRGSRPPVGGAAPFARRRSNVSRRNLVQAERRMSREPPPNVAMALVSPQPPNTIESQTSSIQQLAISVCAVLYSYKPRHSEELELKKGEMVGVYGRFKEGWLRGLSLKTGKLGILPGNYVTPVLRTSAKLVDPKSPPPAQISLPSRRTSTHRSQSVVLALDRVNGDGAPGPATQAPPLSAAPPIATVTQPPASFSAAVRSSQRKEAQGWDTVRRSFHSSHRGSTQRGSHHTLPQYRTQDVPHAKLSGYSPVTPRKKHSLLSLPARPLCWTAEGTALPGGSFQMTERDSAQKWVMESLASAPGGPQSILVKPDSQKNTAEKPVKFVRFSGQDPTPPVTRSTPQPSAGQVQSGGTPPGPTAFDDWGSPIHLGRDGNGPVLKDIKTLSLRKGVAPITTAADGLGAGPKYASIASTQSSPCRHRVASTHTAQTDAEFNLALGELVLVQKPRPDGRVLVTQESTGRTGLFQNCVHDNLDRVS